MKKRTISIILLATIILFSLAACDKVDDKPVTATEPETTTELKTAAEAPTTAELATEPITQEPKTQIETTTQAEEKTVEKDIATLIAEAKAFLVKYNEAVLKDKASPWSYDFEGLYNEGKEVFVGLYQNQSKVSEGDMDVYSQTAIAYDMLVSASMYGGLTHESRLLSATEGVPVGYGPDGSFVQGNFKLDLIRVNVLNALLEKGYAAADKDMVNFNSLDEKYADTSETIKYLTVKLGYNITENKEKVLEAKYGDDLQVKYDSQLGYIQSIAEKAAIDACRDLFQMSKNYNEVCATAQLVGLKVYSDELDKMVKDYEKYADGDFGVLYRNLVSKFISFKEEYEFMVNNPQGLNLDYLQKNNFLP